MYHIVGPWRFQIPPGAESGQGAFVHLFEWCLGFWRCTHCLWEREEGLTPPECTGTGQQIETRKFLPVTLDPCQILSYDGPNLSVLWCLMDVFVEIPNQTFETEPRRKDIWDTIRTALQVGHWEDLEFQVFFFRPEGEGGLRLTSPDRNLYLDSSI